MDRSTASEEQVRAALAKLREPDTGEGGSTKPNRTATKKTKKRTTKATRTKAMPDPEGEDTTDIDDEDTSKIDDEDTTKIEGEDTTNIDDEDTTNIDDEDTTNIDDEDTTNIDDEETTNIDDEDDEDTSKIEDEPAIDVEKKTAIGRGSLSGKAKTPPSDRPGDASGSNELLLSGPHLGDEVVDTGDLEPVSEAVRYILARTGDVPDANLPKRLAVVAAFPGEGASTISKVFSSVLCDDFAIETCRVDLSWESTSQPGVYEVLIGEADVDDVLDWNGPRATLHSGGVSPSERHRLARSEELDKLIAVLAGRFQHLVLDLPAILSGSDGLAMMRFADAYLLVVKHGVTTLRQVKVATDQLSGVELLGCVLNQVQTRTPRPLSRWLAG